MTTAAITSKNQLTLPKEVRTKLGVGAGDTVVFEPQADGSFNVRARQNQDWNCFADILAPHLRQKKVKPTTAEDINRAIGDFVARDHARILGRRK